MKTALRPWCFLLPALATLGALAGCASGLPGARPLTYATPGEARLFVSAGKCPHEPDGDEAAGLAVAVLTGVASELLSNFGTALKQGAAGGNLPSSVSTLNMTLDPGVIPRCIVIVRGAFEQDKRNPTEKNLRALFGEGGEAEAPAELKGRLDAFNFVPVYRVDHLIEIQVVSSSNSKALTFAPIFVRIDRSMDDSKEGERDISIALSFKRLGHDEVGSTVVVADRLIGEEPTVMKRHAVTKRFTREAPWFGSFHARPTIEDSAVIAAKQTVGAPSDAVPTNAAVAPDAGVVGGGGAGAGEVSTVAGSAPASMAVTLFSKGASAVPVTLTATVVETRPTNEGLAFIASIFNGVKPKLEEALKPIIDPSLKDAADEAAASAAYTVEADYSRAYQDAEGAIIAYCHGASSDSTPTGQADRIKKSGDARVAQLKANAAALKAGKSNLPYKKPVSISSAPPSSATGCLLISNG